MQTSIEIDGTTFLVNGRPTYAGRTWEGRSLQGRLMNSRMVQAIFDDCNPETRPLWAYPDTGAWDPDRNTDEFFRALPLYRDHGLLAVTVGLQGGGSIYTPEVYQTYDNSAFAPDGAFRQPYFDRLLRVLAAADRLGLIVIVNVFYVQMVRRIPEDATIKRITEAVCDWLLGTGFRNVLVDLVNESAPWWKRPLMEPDRVHELIEIAQQTRLNGRRLLVGVSTAGGAQLPTGRWRALEDVSFPHGNGCTPAALGDKLHTLQATDEHRARPRPIVVNEDSVFVENLEAAVRAGCSWGFYCQGYGSDYKDRMDWKARGRERDVARLSGFQTVPVNWTINTPIKQAFFGRLRERFGSGAEGTA